MSIEQCLGSLCFTPLSPSAPKFFGFSEYLAALALMVVVWTTTDIRYRFRIATAPLPLHRLTFASLAFVGVLALLTDLWRAQAWLVPKGNLLTPATWQAFLGAIFMLTFLTWAWFAYVKPPKFGKLNAERFGQYIYWTIIEGTPSEMAIIAQELSRSVGALIEHAPNNRRLGGYLPDEEPPEPTRIQGYADDILLLIADQRFCRTLVASSPGTIFEIFQEMQRTKKYGISVSQFSSNVVGAAIENPDSFIYHEADGYRSGLLGYLKPISLSIFGAHQMVEEVGSLLDPDYRSVRKWSADQWLAYNRAVLITLESYARESFWNHSFVLARALDRIGNAASDLYKINGIDGGGWEQDAARRLDAAVDFCKEAVKILNESDKAKNVRLRIRKGDPPYYRSIVDRVVDVIFELIFSAASVKRPRHWCWTVQHNMLWGEFFSNLQDDGAAGKIIKFKLRRKIYDEILTATEWPNFKNIKLLGFCLNVLGLQKHEGSFGRDSRLLQKPVLAWTKKHFVVLEERSPQVFAECLPEGLSYDKENFRLVRTSEADAFRHEPQYFYFELDRPS